jgi:hypothetical protein
MANTIVINETPRYSLSVAGDNELQLTLNGPAGPVGATGATGAAGPNTITTSTTTNLTGLLKGDGSTVSAATAGTDYATAAQGTDERVPTSAGLTSKFATNKATIADNDRVAILDSAASNAPKHSLWSLVKSTLKTYFDTIYAALVHTHVSADITDADSTGAINGVLLKTDSNGDLSIGGDFECLSVNNANGYTTQGSAAVMPSGVVPTGSDTATTFPAAGGEAYTTNNKRIPPRVTTITSSGTPTVNSDNCDMVTITAQAEAITSMTTNLTGTPNNGEMLLFRIKDDGTARAIAWGASFEAMGAALPTTTVLSKVLHALFIWDSVDSKWGCLSTSQEA